MAALPQSVIARGFSGSYHPEDVTFLLKTVELSPTDVVVKEQLIQSGQRHYSEMLSPEYPPDAQYIRLYRAALDRNGVRLAKDIVSLAAALDARSRNGREIVLASLARAGTPIGILLARALRRRGRRTAHYSISIIRDRGLDAQALAYIAAHHDPREIVFIDGWTGKGAIANELRASLTGHSLGIVPLLAVVADPAGQADIAATDDDYLIASGILNGVVSGLISRSILNTELVGPGDFHACVHYRHLAPHDLSRAFVDEIDAIAAQTFPRDLDHDAHRRARLSEECEHLVAEIMNISSTVDRNRIKPGIAEATRAVLRRVPQRLFVRDLADPDVQHLLHLAAKKGIHVDRLSITGRYRAVAVIKSLGSQSPQGESM